MPAAPFFNAGGDIIIITASDLLGLLSTERLSCGLLEARVQYTL